VIVHRAGNISGARIFGLLFWWRMRYFAAETFRLLVRRWQTTVFLLLMASPAMTPLIAQLHALGMPVLSLLEPGHFKDSAGLWLLLLAIAWGWSALQAGALSGGAGWRYLSLPLPPRRIRWLNLGVLTVIDLPLLLPFCAAEFTLLHRFGMQAFPSVVAVAALAMQLPVVQLLAQQRWPCMVYCLVADIAGLAAAATGKSIWLVALAVLVGNLLGLTFSTRVSRSSRVRSIKPPSCLLLNAEYGRPRNIAAINLRYLFGSFQFGRYLGLLFWITLPVALHELLRTHDIGPAAMLLILSLGLIPLVLHTAGLVFDLQRLHAPMTPLHTVYGLGVSWLHRVNSAVLQAVFLAFCLPMMSTLLLHGRYWQALAVLPIGMLMLAACIRLNYWNVDRAIKR